MMRNNDPQRDAAARLRSFTDALNTPVTDIDSMTDEQVSSYLRERGKDPAQLQALLLERLRQINQSHPSVTQRTDDSSAVGPTDDKEDPFQNRTLKGVLDAIGLDARQLGEAINIPFPVSLTLVRDLLDELPIKLTERVSRVLGLDAGDAALIMGRIPAPERTRAMLLRSRTGETAMPTRRRTFRAAMLQCKGNGELSPEQEQDWKEELGL